jgi:hypothetical protein
LRHWRLAGVDRLAREEEDLRAEFADLARRTMPRGPIPRSPDFLNFTHGGQPWWMRPFGTEAFCARDPTLGKTRQPTQENVITALRSSRVIKPHFNNWLLFSAMIEANLCKAGIADWDAMRIDIRPAPARAVVWATASTAKGGVPLDYYNSFVIQPC